MPKLHHRTQKPSKFPRQFPSSQRKIVFSPSVRLLRMSGINTCPFDGIDGRRQPCTEQTRAYTERRLHSGRQYVRVIRGDTIVILRPSDA